MISELSMDLSMQIDRWLYDNFDITEFRWSYASNPFRQHAKYKLEFKNPEDEIMCRLKFNINNTDNRG